MVGDLRLRHAPVIGELERLPLQRCQGRQGRAHAAVLGAQLDDLRDRVVVDVELPGAPGSTPLPVGLVAPHPVDGPSVHERHDPRPGRPGLRIKAARVCPHLGEGLLQRILREVLVAQDAQRQPVRGRTELPV